MCIRQLRKDIARLDFNIAYCEQQGFHYLREDLIRRRQYLYDLITSIKQGVSIEPNQPYDTNL